MDKFDSPEPAIRFRTIARANGIAVSDDEISRLAQFVSGILEWNSKINLISRKDEEKIWEAHILSSVAPLFMKGFPPDATILDIGTGGGFPGIPLAILRPSIRFILLDSIAKKIRALDAILSGLHLPNVTTVCERAEALALREGYRGSIDYVVSRAVASVRDLLKLAKPFLRIRNFAGAKEGHFLPGSVILYKGGVLDDEIERATLKFKPRAVEIIPVVIGGRFDDAAKKIVIIQP